MVNRQQKLARAVNILSKYFGVHTVSDLAARIALDQLSDVSPSASGRGMQNQSGGVSRGPNDNQRYRAIAPSEEERRLIELLIDTTEGSRTTYQIIRELTEQINNADNSEDLRNRFGRLLQIHYAQGSDGPLNFVVPEQINVNEELNSGDGDDPTISRITDIDVVQMLGYGENDTRINRRPSEPSKEHPGLSIILTNSPRVTLESQNASAATIFLNGIPNIEMSRATPYVNIDFFFPRPSIGPGGRLQSLSINKFLFGAKTVTPGSPDDVMARANTTEGRLISSQQEEPGRPIPEVYSIAGMELFTTPQTLINADAIDVESAERSNPVLDKFRPFMTLQDLSLSVAPSAGMMSFKRGTLTIILHDRSRLPEMASFVKPDLYGQNEIQIEYGWSHPDARSSNTENAYGDLIDGFRMKEKYMVVNSSFNFDNSGQVIIKLNIAMRGSSAFNTQLMSSDNETFGNLIQEIEELQQTIGELRQRVFPPSTVSTQQEIRGRQILDAAQDIMSHPNLTNDLRDALRDFRNAYRNSSNPEARQLVESIERIFGNQITQRRRGQSLEPSRTGGDPTVVQRVRRTIQDSVRRKVQQLQNGPDPFLVTDEEIGTSRLLATGRNLSNVERRRLSEFERSAFGVDLSSNFPVSLAKLMLTFIGEPLANTGNYDDVQLIFYPFNEYAGKANGLNIGNFLIDAGYFADELARYRLNHIGRSSVMSLREFTQFLTDTILDDPAAPSYGLKDENGPFFEPFVDENSRVAGTRPVDEAPDHQTRIQALLQGVTPDGTFRMPQIGIYIESLPEIAGTTDGEDSSGNNGKTILRLHIFDRLCSTYGTLGQLLSATRTEQLQSVGRYPRIQGRNTGVREIRESISNATIASAEATGLLQRIPSGQSSDPPGSGDPGPDTQYRIVGGPQKIKEFIMQNTPYIIFGAGGTTIKNAQLASLQEPALNTVNLIRSFRREESITPNGEDAGGLPMQIIPTQLSLDCFGNPLINYAQRFFVDFQTGTTADNFYSVIGIDHKFTQGDFTTSIRFAPDDAWGQYRSFLGVVTNAIEVLRDVQNEQDQQRGNSGAQTGTAQLGTGPRTTS